MKRFPALLAALLVLAACVPDNGPQQEAGMPETLKLSFGDPQVTHVPWHTNNAVCVFASEGEPERYVYDPGRRSFVRFTDMRTYESDFGRCYVISPFGDVKIVSEGEFEINLPNVQKYSSAGIETDLLVGVTESMESSEASMHSPLGYIGMHLTGKGKILSVRLSGNHGETLTGPAVLKAGPGKIPVLTMLGSGADTLSLDFGKGVDLPADGLKLFFAVPPVSFPDGVSLTVVQETGESSMSLESPFEVSRGRVTELEGFGTGTSFLSFALIDKAGQVFKCKDCLGPKMTVCVPLGTDISALTPVFSHNGGSVSVGGKEVVSGKTPMDFTKAKSFTVSGGENSEKYTVSAVDIDIPVLYVSTPGHRTIADKETWIPESTFIIEEVDGTVNDYGAASVKGRGNASWKREKKSYGIKLAEKPKDRPVLGMPGHKRWCIIAVQWGYLGNNVGYELARRTSSYAWQPHGRYVEFVLNGEHRGTYFLAEQIRIDKNRVDIKSLDPDEIGEDKISGGYLLTYDRTFNDPNRFESKYFKMPVMIKDPDDDDLQPEQFAWIQNYINTMEEAMYDDAKFAKHEYLDYFDIDTYIDMWFVWELAGATGSHGGADFAHPNSVWFYKDRGGVLKAGPCWDFDSYLFSNQALLCNTGQYYGRLFKDPLFVARVKEKWPEFRASVEGKGKYKTPITEFIDSCYNTVLYSAKRNQKMWDWTMFKYDEEYKTIREGLPAKMQWLEDQIMGFK